MADALLRLFFPEHQLKASVVLATESALEAQRRHELRPVAAALLGHALAAGALLASLQKADTRLNLQVECDGALRGLLVDASSTGALRGYVKNPLLEVEGPPGEFHWRPALGNAGFLSVVRDQGNSEFYRSSVELKAFDLAQDLENYFQTSDQVPTRVGLALRRDRAGGLLAVGGVLLQALPDGDLAVLQERGSALGGALERALQDEAPTVESLAAALFQGLPYQPTGTLPIEFRCTCSREAVLSMLAALGKTELQAMLQEQGKAEVTCHFCGERYQASAAELQALIGTAS